MISHAARVAEVRALLKVLRDPLREAGLPLAQKARIVREFLWKASEDQPGDGAFVIAATEAALERCGGVFPRCPPKTVERDHVHSQRDLVLRFLQSDDPVDLILTTEAVALVYVTREENRSRLRGRTGWSKYSDCDLTLVPRF